MNAPASAAAADVLVIFGITGDLARKMTFRSLYRLERRGLLDCPIVGVAVDDWSLDQLAQRARDSIVGTGEQLDEKVFKRLVERFSYVQGDFGDPGVYERVAEAISGAETVLFLESTALFAQSVAELHGIPVEDPDRARALVLAMVVGGPSQELIMQFSGQATGRGPAKPEFWGTLLAKNLPRTAVTQFMDRVRKVYLPRMLASAGGGVVGRVLPFGVGAVVGGAANQILGRRVVNTARTAFGPPPRMFPASTEPKVVAPGPRASRKAERAVAAGERRAIRAAKRRTPPPQPPL